MRQIGNEATVAGGVEIAAGPATEPSSQSKSQPQPRWTRKPS